jgi:hypothetical protein
MEEGIGNNWQAWTFSPHLGICQEFRESGKALALLAVHL